MPKSKVRVNRKKRNATKDKKFLAGFDTEIEKGIEHISSLVDYIDKMDGIMKSKAEKYNLMEVYEEQAQDYKVYHDKIKSELSVLRTKKKELKSIKDVTESIAYLPKLMQTINDCINEANISITTTNNRLNLLNSEKTDG